MALFTVIIPTHNHPFGLKFSVRSVLNQTYQDFVLYVIGDGQGPDTDAIMDEILTWDDRVNYIPNKKGEGYGELYRHELLKKVQSKYVAYLGDDDLWLTNHLKVIEDGLKNCDFVHTIHTVSDLNFKLKYYVDDVNFSETKELMSNRKYNFFGLGCTAHRLDSYHKLPFGWRPKPLDLWSDFYMFRQWLDTENISVKTLFYSTTVKLPSGPRKNISENERVAELKIWKKKINHSSFNLNNSRMLRKYLNDGCNVPFEKLLKKAERKYYIFNLSSAQSYLSKASKYDKKGKAVYLLRKKIKHRKNSILYRVSSRVKRALS